MAMLARVISALPNFLIAGTALTAWVAPELLPPRTIAWLMMLMLLEFIVIHSNGLLGMAMFSKVGVGRRLTILIGGGLFYSIFAAGFSAAAKSWWPLISFWILMGNRMIHALMVREYAEFEKKLMQASWAAAVMFYLAAVFLTTLLPVPRLGITSSVVATQDIPGSGGWVDKPWTVVAACAIYFMLMGLYEIFWAEKMARSLKVDKNGQYRF